MARKKIVITAAGLVHGLDPLTMQRGIEAVLTQGGAVMLGQTRDQAKLIVTTYLDGDKEVEYLDSTEDGNKLFAELGVEGA